MKTFPRLSALAIIAATTGVFALGAPAVQAQQKRVSPHETVSTSIEGSRVTIVYGRPFAKDPRTSEVRKIWGGLVPAGQVWRMGADEATLLITQEPLAFGDVTVPAGAYSLFMLPEEGGAAKLIINKQVGQWGTQYDAKQDLASIALKSEPLEKTAEQFTASIEKNPGGGGVLRFFWENTQFSAAFTVQK